MKEKLIEIINELKEACKGMKIKDSEYLEQAIKLFISQNINESKDRRIKEFREAEPQTTKEEPATYKQKKYLEFLGYDGDLEKLSKTEAKQLIEEMKGGDKNDN